MDSYDSWPQAIRAARGEATQLAFAAALKITPMTVSRWERGAERPGKFTRALLARRFRKLFTPKAMERFDAQPRAVRP